MKNFAGFFLLVWLVLGAIFLLLPPLVMFVLASIASFLTWSLEPFGSLMGPITLMGSLIYARIVIIGTGVAALAYSSAQFLIIKCG